MTRPVRRLLASDLDGTFLDSRGRVTPANRDALQQARANGLRVVFATGRPARWLHSVVDSADHYDMVIGCNGGFIADMRELRVIHNDPIDPAAAREAAQRVIDKFPQASFGVERAFVGMPVALNVGQGYKELEVQKLSPNEFAMTRGYGNFNEEWLLTREVPELGLDELLNQSDMIKIVIKPATQQNWDADSWLAAIEPLVSDILQVTHASQDAALAELSAPGVTKGKAVSWLAGEWGLRPEDVVAVGDMPNDCSMLSWAGEAWAVANAHTEVLALTENRLPHHDENAVAHLIADLLARG